MQTYVMSVGVIYVLEDVMSDASSDGKQRYAQYLESDEWKVLREEAIERAGGRCQLCGEEPDTIHVHHNRYPDTWGEEESEDLIALCADCHQQHHDLPEAFATANGIDFPHIKTELRELKADIVYSAGKVALWGQRDVCLPPDMLLKWFEEWGSTIFELNSTISTDEERWGF